MSIDHGWTAELGSVGDPGDVSGEWVTRGTLFTPPLLPMIAQGVLTVLALLRRRAWRLVAGAGLALLGALYLAGGLGEPLDSVASDPSVVVYALLRITGLIGAVGLIAAGAATVVSPSCATRSRCCRNLRGLVHSSGREEAPRVAVTEQRVEDLGAPATAAPAEPPNPTLQRLDEQIAWYDTKSRECQLRYKGLKAVVIIGAAAIPVIAAFDVPVYVAGILGGIVVVVEGLLQAYQYHKNWITYRSTAESLKHEKYLYLARADAYAYSKKPLRLLAERIEGLISQEHARWISSRRQRDDEERKDESESEEPEA